MVNPLVFRIKNVIIDLLAFDLSGFISCKDFIAFNPNGVAAEPSLNIFAITLEDI